jgi:transcriptional regulator of acetoin/glycerol metabolism
MYVCGAEHFAERFINYACYGAPIINPLTGRLEGAVTLVCNSVDASPLMMPFVEEMSGAIEDRLRAFATRREQALLDAFTRAAHSARRPVIAVNDKTIISNPLASRLLEGVEHATLWEHAAEAISTRRASHGILRTPTGIEIHATFCPLLDGGEVLGAIGELDTAAIRSLSAEAIPVPERRGLGPLRELVGGSSRPWLHALELVYRAARTHEPMLLVGEAGTGKLHLARAVHELNRGASEANVFDAALAAVDGAALWLRRVQGSLESSSTLILRHLEVLDRRTSLALASLLDEVDIPGETRAQVIGLFTTLDPQPDSQPSCLAERMAVHRIGLPPLRERSVDIPDLVRRIAAKLGLPGLIVSSDALQALMRSPWPGNVRQLAAVVRRAIAGRSCGTIGLADLPIEAIENKASTFTTFEKAEYQAIVQALRFADGNKKAAAAELGIARSTLYRKLRSYRIDLDRATF